MTHEELVELGRRWLGKPWKNCAALGGHASCSVITTELANGGTAEIPDVLGWDYRGSILIECKTSLADFRADAKKPFRQRPVEGLGRQRWFLAPVGIIPPDELPAGWGLLEVGARRHIEVVRMSSIFEHHADETVVLLSVLRRLKVDAGPHISLRVFSAETTNRATLTLESGPTRSEALVSRVRSLCHEATRSGEASPLIVAALELCEEHEIVVAQALRAERTIHEMTKGGAA